MPEIDLKLIEHTSELLPEKVILHIGMTKAGSTAIQNVFEKNYEYLFNQGVLFPKSIFSRKNPYAQNRTSGHLQLIRDISAGNLEEFIAELERTRGQINKIFLSAENLFQDVKDGDLQHLARLLTGKALEIVIIFRSQTDWLPSRFYQSVTGGDKREWRSFDRFVDTMIEEGNLNYYERVKFVAGILNADNVVAFDYDQIKKQGGSIAVIARHLGLEEKALQISLSEPESNISLPLPEALEAHRRLNLAAFHLPPDAYQSWCSEMESMIFDFARQRNLKFSHIRPDRELRKRIIETCIEPNLQLSRELLAGKPFGPKKSSIRSKDPEPLDESIVNQVTIHGLELMAPYIQRLRSEAGQERSRAARFKSGLDSARKQPTLLSAQITKLAGQLSAANDKIVKLQEKYATASSDYNQQKKQTATISKSLAATEQALESTSEKLSATVEERDSLKARVANLTDELASVNHDKSALSTKLKAAEHKVTNLTTECKKHKKKIKGLEETHKESQAWAQRALRRVTEERDSFVRYADDLEVRFLRVLKSRTWRMLGPYRVVIRKMRSYLRGRRVPPNRLPKRPAFQRSGREQRENTHTNRRKRVRNQAIRNVKKDKEIVNAHRIRMLELGFRERGYRELEKLAQDKSKPSRQKLAALQLAVFHLNQGNIDGSSKAVKYLDICRDASSSRAFSRRVAILHAEAYLNLGEMENARTTLESELKKAEHPDVYLGLANLESTAERKLSFINNALRLSGLSEISLHVTNSGTRFDSIGCMSLGSLINSGAASPPLVSIIVPAYNSQSTIATALSSLLCQTWMHFELLVVDDCSTDKTPQIVEQFASNDNRIRLIKLDKNSGPYVARNTALKQSKGQFVTCHDADDWSHPQKLETQVRHLISNPSVIANTSNLVRATDDLEFSRREGPGVYTQINMSSLLFRRKEVIERVGYWDSVRFASDSEFKQRLESEYGKQAVVNIRTAPLSFLRQGPESLTTSPKFGYPGYKMGARLEYERSHDCFHKLKNPPYISFPQGKREFPVPRPMRPEHNPPVAGNRHFDIILVSDFRFPGGTSSSNAEEIKANIRLGLRTGLVQMNVYQLQSDREMNPKIRQLIDGEQVEIIVYGEEVSCEVLILRHPWILQDRQEYLPKIEAKNVRVIVNQPPKRDYGSSTESMYDIPHCLENIRHYFGSSGVWHPIGPLVRSALLEHHAKDLEAIDLSDVDWTNIIDVSNWRRPERPKRSSKIQICRHSRDHYVKWPESPEDILKAYPNSDAYEVHILGGAETPKEILGGDLPSNWHIYEFGTLEPREFLSMFDVFIYYTHSGWIESFGRVIFEAMAVGLPVILSPDYEPLFKDAAVYSYPSDVELTITKLMEDEQIYSSQVSRACGFVESNFGYSSYANRLNLLSPGLVQE